MSAYIRPYDTHALKEAQDTCLQKQEPSYFSFQKKKKRGQKSGRRHVPGVAGAQLFLRETAPVPLPGRRVSVGICTFASVFVVSVGICSWRRYLYVCVGIFS